jgi:hypothetical protein
VDDFSGDDEEAWGKEMVELPRAVLEGYLDWAGHLVRENEPGTFFLLNFWNLDLL